MRSLWHRVVKLDLWLEQFRLPIILLALVVLLRIPTFFEPYWYGDEGIYLVLGEALNRGKILYAEIIDHKTPLIYLFAQVGSQLSFRLLILGWLVAATAVFIRITNRLFTQQWSRLLAVLFWIAAISLPSFEGTIPNGELFVAGFVLVGVALAQSTAFWKTAQKNLTKKDALALLGAGSAMGLGILTKVPALLDFAALMCALLFVQFPSPVTIFTDLGKRLGSSSRFVFVLLLGALIPIAISVLFFVLRGVGQSYLDFGLLYNFRYAGTWQPSFPHPVFGLLFSLPGKTAILGVVLLSIWGTYRQMPKYLSFSLIWFWFALFASLLSNRPYPHYFLQVAPPLALLLGSVLESFLTSARSRLLVLGAMLPAAAALISIIFLLDVHPYPTLSYYQNWWRYMSGKQTVAQYNQWFNPLMDDNYAAAKLIRQQGNGQLFIWGTNPMLYALSDTIPTGRFTVSFHIHDFKAYAETLQDLKQSAPPFIVMMHDEQGELPGLKQFLHTQYRLYRTFDHYDVWKKYANE